MHLYEESGADCIVDLDGMFAIAIWDERAKRLTLARDRAGKKPLFYYRDERLLAFASEIKSFFAHPDIAMEPDPDAVPYVLYPRLRARSGDVLPERAAAASPAR